MLTAQRVKDLMRADYARITPRSYLEAVERSLEFWARYEQFNRDNDPDDPVYSVVRTGITPVAGNDLFTFVGATGRQARILEIMWGSEGTASAAQRHVWQRSTGGTTGGGALTPEKFAQGAPASGSFANIFTTWSAQPTLSGNPTLAFANNALGGFYDWKAIPGTEIYVAGTEQNSYRNAAGTAVGTFNVVFEEW